LAGLAPFERLDERALVERVGLDEAEVVADRVEVRVAVRGARPGHSEDLVALVQEELGQIRAILAADPSDERARPVVLHAGLARRPRRTRYTSTISLLVTRFATTANG